RGKISGLYASGHSGFEPGSRLVASVPRDGERLGRWSAEIPHRPRVHAKADPADGQRSDVSDCIGVHPAKTCTGRSEPRSESGKSSGNQGDVRHNATDTEAA